MIGTVTKLNFAKQYTFIAGEDGQKYFAHFSQYEDAFLSHDERLIGQRVRFDPASGNGKRPVATNIVAEERNVTLP